MERMSLDEWQAIGIVCGSALAALALAGWAWKGIRRMWRLGKKFSWWMDQLMGTPADGDQPARPGLMARLTGIEDRLTGIETRLGGQSSRLADHVEWHGDLGGAPAYQEPPAGPVRRRRR